MIKKEIISLIKNHVGKIDKTQDFHLRFLEAVIERTLVEMYADMYKINPNLVNGYTKTFGITTPISIRLEANTGLHYITLPSQIVNLPCVSSGVRRIFPLGSLSVSTSQSGNIFVPMTATESDLLYNTDVAVVTSKVGYRVRQDKRVDLFNAGSLYALNVTVGMDLLIPFSEYADTDDVMIPELTGSDAPPTRYGGRTQASTFIDRVLDSLKLVPPADLRDNNAPSQSNQNNSNQ